MTMRWSGWNVEDEQLWDSMHEVTKPDFDFDDEVTKPDFDFDDEVTELDFRRWEAETEKVDLDSMRVPAPRMGMS